MPLKSLVIFQASDSSRAQTGFWTRAFEILNNKLGSFDCEKIAEKTLARPAATKACREGRPLIIGCGTDGTINEIVNGIHDAKCKTTPALGILNRETKSDLLRSLDIPEDLEAQVRAIASKNTRQIDLGLVEYKGENGKKESRIFVNMAQAGLRISSPFTIFQSCISPKSKEIRISFDHPVDLHHPHFKDHHEWSEKCLAVVVANGRFFGGGMPIAPTASLDDGYFDLIVVGELNPLKSLLAVPLLYGKQLIRLPEVHFDRVRSITLTSNEPVPLDIDGEPIGRLPARFEILPKVLRVKTG